MEVLAVLARNAGRVVSRNELMEEIWADVVVTEHTLSRCIYLLRHELGKIAAAPGQGEVDPIETLPKRGYRLRVVVETVPPHASVASAGPRRGLSRPRAIGVAAALVLAAAAGLYYLLDLPAGDQSAETAIAATSIAVLPFENRSPNPENAYFADGVHDDLLMLLSRIGDLKVVSRTSVERFRGTDATIPEIGRTLNVGHVLEGAVQRVDDRVRVSVQLIDAVADHHVWAEAFDRQLTAANLFAIQSEIAAAIADTLQATLSADERERLLLAPTDNLAAYEAYIRGRQRLAERSSMALAAAAEYFERAIALDPEFALAYVGLADSHALGIVYIGEPQDEMIAKAEPLLDKALTLDPRLGEAYASLGWLSELKNDPVAAEAAYMRALELNPNYVTTHHWYGALLLRSGRSEDALAQHLKGLELDPLSANLSLHVGNDLELLGRFEEALGRYMKAIELDPSFSVAYATIADVHWFVHADLAEATGWYRQAIALDPGNPVTPAWFGRLYLDLQDQGRAEYWIQRAIELAPTSADANYAQMLLYLYRGEDDRVVESAGRIYEQHPMWFATVQTLLRDDDIRHGSYSRARDRYAGNYPALTADGEPAVDATNYWAAIDLALVYQLMGDDRRADQLLAGSLAVLHELPRLGIAGYGIADVRAHALRGDSQRALTTLRQAIDQGWRREWWYWLGRDPSLASIRGQSEFQSMLEDIEADMSAQLARTREVDVGFRARTGDFAARHDRAPSESSRHSAHSRSNRSPRDMQEYGSNAESLSRIPVRPGAPLSAY